MTVRNFADEVSRDTPAPGGGSIAALAGALGASLASMVANLTQGKTDTDEQEQALLGAAQQAQAIKDRLILAVDDDTNAFNVYMDARRLPQNTGEEKSARDQAMQDGLKTAINVPYQTAMDSFHAIEVAYTAAVHGNPNSITDAAVGAQMGFAGVRGGLWNVMINLKDITDKSYVRDMRAKCDGMLKDSEILLAKVTRHVDEKLAARLQQ
jgi:glutamate formiminotransferase/formiminotetrahydrofolate cyclodeaminase